MRENKYMKNLSDEMITYFSEEVRNLTGSKELLVREMQQLRNEKNRKIRETENFSYMYKNRNAFSPLEFYVPDEKKQMIDTSDIDQEIAHIAGKIQRSDHKIEILTGYMEGLEEIHFNDGEAGQEDLPFVAAFTELLGYVRKLHPQLRLNYEKSEADSGIKMNLSFLKGFQAIMNIVVDEIGCYVMNIEQYIDKYKVLIQINIKPKLKVDIHSFEAKKENLQKILPKEFSVLRWKTNSIMIQALMEQ
jgi:hypothetical protein